MAAGEKTQQAPRASLLGDTINLTRQAAVTYDRHDLAKRLDTAAARLADAGVRVLVVGEYKQGKSTLVNQLLDAPVCPVDDDVATSVPTVIRFGEPPAARAFLRADGGGGEGVDVPLDRLADFVTEGGNPGNARRVDHAEVAIRRKLLAQGLVIVDTPGVGGLGSIHTAATMAALPWADAVLFVSDASQELTAPEVEFLRTARDLCPHVVSVLTKIDLYPEWRRIQSLDAAHLERERLPRSLIPVSSALRARALRSKDPNLNAESGFPPLVTALERLLQMGAQVAARTAAHDILAVVEQLMLAVDRERQVLSDPSRGAAVVEEMANAKDRADRLRAGAAKWQQTLGDGVADLTADLDHDLRVRTRTVLREAEEAIDQGDPAKSWDELQSWLTRRVAAEMGRNYLFLAQRAKELAERVAEHFAGEEMEIGLRADAQAPEDMIGAVRVAERVGRAEQGLAQQGLLALRGVYSGVSMFSALGSLAGLAMLQPFTVVLGLFMGRSAIREQRERQLTARRNEAKGAARKYVDEVTFQVGKDSRDSLRGIQRWLRDTFAARADELVRSAQESLAAAQRAVQADEAGRQRRMAELNREIEALGILRARALTVAPDLVQATRR